MYSFRRQLLILHVCSNEKIRTQHGIFKNKNWIFKQIYLHEEKHGNIYGNEVIASSYYFIFISTVTGAGDDQI